MIKLIIIICVGLSSACALTKLTRGGYEEAQHEVLIKENSIELRRYSELQMVVTDMSNNQDNGFMRLFRYIDSGNKKKQKIAMTTPVFTSRRDGKSTMAFVLPADMKSVDVPKPDQDTVKRITRPAGMFAVYRYSGRHRTSPPQIKSKLRKWIEENNLLEKGNPTEAFYDPPWMPGIFRRNELLIPVTQPEK
tara:strand:- start:526 stop:1101 length:576 start_codon:yes stop_codon:yes gene_type:complete